MGLPSDGLTGSTYSPVFVEVQWLVASTSEGQAIRLVATVELSLVSDLWETEEVQPAIEILASPDNFIVAEALATFETSIDDVDCRGKVCSDVILIIDIIWHEETSHDVVHAGLWWLREHVEPDTGCHSCVAVQMNLIWVLK